MNGLRRVGARIEPRTWAILASLAVGIVVILQFIAGLWVADSTQMVGTGPDCPPGAVSVPNSLLSDVFPPDCILHVPAHFETAYLGPGIIGSVVRDAAIAGILTFLVFTPVRWAWKSYR